MKYAKIFLNLVIFIGLILVSVAACGWNGGSGPVDGTPQPSNVQPYYLTATYGAGVFHVQLTAIAINRPNVDMGNP